VVSQLEEIFKVYQAEIRQIDEDNHTVEAVVSTEAPDRDKEGVSIAGFQKGIKHYQEHPVLLSCHQWRDLQSNIGKALGFKFEDGKVIVTFEYFVGKGNAESDWGYQLAKEGIAAYSIGFIPEKWREPDENEQKMEIRRIHTDFEVVEISQVLIPSNREALDYAKIYKRKIPKQVTTIHELMSNKMIRKSLKLLRIQKKI
jgi:hypothetical protein